MLYFYPKDDTPGCTTGACAFRDLEPQFASANYEFADKHFLPFPLLADPDYAIAEAYGACKERTNYGKTDWGIERTTFVVDKDGLAAKTYPRVRVDQHSEAVLQLVQGLADRGLRLASAGGGNCG